MKKIDTILRTKLHQPFTRSGLVSRPRLLEQISKGLLGPLTLVTAPAGYGKTTLVSSCLANCGLRTAWLSLDEGDNHTGRFLSYLIAAIQEADNTIGGGAVELMAVSQQEAAEAVLTSLINDLDSAEVEIGLVLDDYQEIHSQAIHEEIAFLLEHCPKKFHLVIATRSDPPLPLARLRARGQTTELRTADLLFTKTEAKQFLNEIMGLHLDERSVATLNERTEGWITGLQMAALSMRDRKDVSGFIEGFSGTNRYILDYLLEEVLASQPPEVQRFLLCTSILERLTAPLCDAVIFDKSIESRERSVERSNKSRPNSIGELSSLDSRSILEYLERANLFLIPLDDERIWYRYHHLFADLLQTRLQQTLKIQDIAALHTRAAKWYIHNGLSNEAIQHASLTLNNEWVEQLIEQNYMEMFHRGEASSMRFWTGKLSKELIYRRPWLCIYEAQSHALFGQLDEAEVLLAKAEEHLQLDNPSADSKSMLGHLAYIKSRVTGMRGNVPRAIELSLTARENTPASNQALQSGIGVNLGVGYFLNGDFTNAIQTFNETIQSGIAANAINGTIAAYCHLARLYAIQGQLHKSYKLYQEARKFAREAGGRNLGVMSLVDMGIANVLYELNDLEAALAHIKQGLDFIPLWGNADDIALAYTTHARILQAQWNTAGAAEAIEKGIHLIQTCGVFSEARDAVITAEVRLWLAEGNIASASRWVDSLKKNFDSNELFLFKNELRYITLARIYTAQKKLGEAVELLSQLEADAESGERTGRQIEILILKAQAMQKLGKPEPALELLAKSLKHSEPEGYVRVFLDEGEPIQMLLSQWLAHAGASPLRDYATRLLSQFDAEPNKTAKTLQKGYLTNDLIEPLSQRELEVLHLVALGKTNQEIARQLIVSTGTVKAHTASIFRKLDAANRTEAVANARQLGILP